MPGRAVFTSPCGTGEISIPDDPNFMCTGLVTVAPFFGSTKNTRGLPAFLGAWATAGTLNAPIISIPASASDVLAIMQCLLHSRGALPHIPGRALTGTHAPLRSLSGAHARAPV